MSSSAYKVYSNLNGVVFGMFRQGKLLLNGHPLDTHKGQYYKTVEEIVIPECMKVTPGIPECSERIKELLSYTHCLFSDVWNYHIELMYRTVADEAHQTEENITKLHLLRASSDLLCSMGCITDDICDNSDYRKGKKCWHKICTGGTPAAVNDAILVGLLPEYLLRKYFKNDPGYVRMLELLNQSKMTMVIGQILDITKRNSENFKLKNYMDIVHNKVSNFWSIGTGLSLLHAGILCDDLIKKSMDAIAAMGTVTQVWDDFTDYYCTIEETGKPSLDFENAATTWASVTAMEHFNPAQAREFKECYGSKDPAKQKRVRELYDEIELPRLYVKSMRQSYLDCQRLIADTAHQKVQQALTIYLDWMIGQDVMDEDKLRLAS